MTQKVVVRIEDDGERRSVVILRDDKVACLTLNLVGAVLIVKIDNGPEMNLGCSEAEYEEVEFEYRMVEDNYERMGNVFGVEVDESMELDRMNYRGDVEVLLRNLVCKSTGKRVERHEIRRRRMLDDSMKLFLGDTVDFGSFRLEFSGEIGQDNKGVKRDWFYSINEEIRESGHLEWINGVMCDIRRNEEEVFLYWYDQNTSGSMLDEIRKSGSEKEKFLVFIGLFMGLSLVYGEPLHVNWTLGFYENLLGRRYSEKTLQDGMLRRNIEQELNKDEVIVEYFDCAEYDAIRFGFMHVTNKFRCYDCQGKEWCNLHSLLVKRVECRHLFYYFMKREVYNNEVLRMLEFFRVREQEKGWLTKIIGELSEDELIAFVQFAVGGSYIKDTLCVEQIKRRNILISASTCSDILYVGMYDSKDVMKQKLMTSVFECCGFHLM
ncbi:hypothetical protein ECANGB1_965 [Enterospora canceri]|uniref:HECT-type E3 ubiquitin transferase n=1 Tax=Enterospora canceri TaxID=1081671 RepID=A0A1Y1S759_9MICR|nr:hypothetical protein ECANGB1_965 [Enterospora canceri]